MYKIDHRMPSLFIIASLFLVLQLTAVTYTKVGPPFFNLPLIFLVYCSLKKGVAVGILYGLFFGFFNGLFNISPFGSYCLSYGSIGFIIGYVSRWLYRESLLTFLLMVIFAEGLLYLFHFIFGLWQMQMPLASIGAGLRLMLLSAGCDVMASLFLFHFLGKLKL